MNYINFEFQKLARNCFHYKKISFGFFYKNLISKMETNGLSVYFLGEQQMEKSNKNLFWAITLILILTITTIVPFLVQDTSIATAQTTANSNLLQYEWPNNLAGNKQVGWRVGTGPAPGSQEILWTNKLGYPVAAFNGLLFLSGGRVVDPFTGTLVYNGSFGTPTKLDQYLFFSGNSVYETSSGNRVYGPYNVSISDNYDPELKMFWMKTGGGGSSIFYNTAVEGWSWPDPSQPPTLAWKTDILKNTPFGAIIIGNGKVLVGTLECTAMALDAKTGAILWETPIKSYLNYDGAYYDGKWIHASQQGIIYCFDVNNGNILWQYDPGTFFNYWAYMGAIYDGKIFSINTDNRVYAIDIETGKPVWIWETTEGGVGYQTYTIAGDGKVYAYTGRSDYTNVDTGEPYREEYVCLEAKTGKILWKTTSISGSSRAFGGPPSIYNVLAYGNLYLGDWRGITTAYGPAKDPQPFSNFQGNAPHTGDATRDGPVKLSLKWEFNTDSAIFASPTATDGKIFFGSTAGTFYALDYQSGSQVWHFKTNGAIKSNSAIENGKVFFVSDDGYLYSLRTNDGSQVWKKYIGADAEYFYHTLQKRTGSPVVVDGRIYVGSRNFTMFCLNSDNGDLIWTFNSGGLISNTPAVKDGAVYVSVGGISARDHFDSGDDDATMYKLDASTGSVIWEANLPYARYKGSGQLVGRHLFGSPVVGDGIVFQSANAWLVFGIEASTGRMLWTFNSSLNHDVVTGALPNTLTPVYANGKLYVQDFFRLACLNASTGERIWDQWLGHSVHGGPLYANGKVYVASEIKSLYILDAETGQKLDSYAWQDFCWSSPAIYDNKLYWGTLGMKFYCFEQGQIGKIIQFDSNSPTTPTATPTSQSPNPTNTISPSPNGNSSQSLSNEVLIALGAVVLIIAVLVAATLLRKRK